MSRIYLSNSRRAVVVKERVVGVVVVNQAREGRKEAVEGRNQGRRNVAITGIIITITMVTAGITVTKENITIMVTMDTMDIMAIITAIMATGIMGIMVIMVIMDTMDIMGITVTGTSAQIHHQIAFFP